MKGDDKLKEHLRSASIWLDPHKAREVALIVCEYYARSGVITSEIKNVDPVQVRKWFDETAHQLQHLIEYENDELERQEIEDAERKGTS